MLSELQQHLTEIYRVDPGYRVTDFLITDPALARILGQGSLLANTDETVLVREEHSELSISVFLDEQLLSRLGSEKPLQQLRQKALDDLWTVLEGVSHFNYIAWCARQDKSVTLLELEMQAEIDKFIGTWLLALEQDDCDFADRLHGWLFDNVSFHPELDSEQRERYAMANDYAARFCHRIRRRMNCDGEGGIVELRHFYRLSQPGKLSHIHSQAYNE